MKTKTKFLFLLSWIHGSDGACGEKTKVRTQADLLPQYQNGNQHILSVLIEGTENKEIASAFGYMEAFDCNYTGENSVSMCLKVGPTFKQKTTKTIKVE